MILKIYSLFFLTIFYQSAKVFNLKFDTSVRYLFYSNNSLIKPNLSKHINLSNLSSVHSIIKQEKLSTFSSQLLTDYSIMHNKMSQFENRKWDNVETKREIIEIKSLIEKKLEEGINWKNDENLSNETIASLLKKFNNNNNKMVNSSDITKKVLNNDYINNKINKHLNEEYIFDESVTNLKDLLFIYKKLNETSENGSLNLNNKANFSIYTFHFNKNNTEENFTRINHSQNYLNKTEKDSKINFDDLNTSNNDIRNLTELNFHNFMNMSYDDKQKIHYANKEKIEKKISSEKLSSTIGMSSDFQNSSNKSLTFENNFQNATYSHSNNIISEYKKKNEIVLMSNKTNYYQSRVKVNASNMNEQYFSIENITLFDPFSQLLSIGIIYIFA
jgi:hypothetical protein